MSKSLVAYCLYQEHKDTSREAHYAVKAIQAYAAEGESIPAELLPFIDDICNSWFKDQGQRSRTIKTNENWLKLIAEVDILRNIDDRENDQGLTLEEAVEEVSDNPDNKCTFNSLRTKYSNVKDFPHSDRVSARADLLNSLLK